MTDLTEKLLPILRQNRLPGLDLADEFIYPHYAGRSILNIPSSLCHWLGVPGLKAGPLSADILDFPGSGIRKVVLVLMDALALHRLQRWMADGTAPVWNELTRQGLLAPLTSITPSTTSAALTALWMGRSAAEHGITGYEMWMKEYGVVANTILHAPITYRNDVGSLERAGFDPEKFLPFTPLGAHLAAHGVKTYAMQHHSIAHSGLSRMLFSEGKSRRATKDVEVQMFSTAADLWINARQLLSSRVERMFTWIYWGEVDHFGHFYGPDDERTAAEFSTFSLAMQRYFLERLSPAERRDTLLILTADHGQIATQQEPRYDLRNHPDLLRRLHIQPTGENRLAYLYVRPGQLEAVKEYLECAWPGQFVILESAYAREHGLFGPGEPHPNLLDRLGDLIVVARENAYLWWADKENHLLGRHGGLHPEEMLVPFLAVRL
ncbi:MAG: alkaline phosphatase family protein [Anaerolineales bacterium]|nr:alkaline phosphatase family protein [Anaerolineales bacterium]